MKIYRTEIHGHLLELRYGDFGGQSVFIDGRQASRKPFAGWLPSSSHMLTLEDQSGKSHAVEVRIDAPSLGIGQTYAVVSVDGIERCRLTPIDRKQSPEVCRNCGYSLHGLPTENGEVRCPECGRHTSAALIGRPTES